MVLAIKILANFPNLSNFWSAKISSYTVVYFFSLSFIPILCYHFQDGCQPIHFAANTGQTEVIEFLVDKHGMNPGTLSEVQVCNFCIQKPIQSSEGTMQYIKTYWYYQIFEHLNSQTREWQCSDDSVISIMMPACTKLALLPIPFLFLVRNMAWEGWCTFHVDILAHKKVHHRLCQCTVF